MNRKFTSFLMLLLMMFVSTSVMAQEEELDLTSKSITFGNVVDNFEPNTWYLLHQGRTSSLGNGQYAPALAGQMPESGGFLYDNGLDKNVLKLGVVNIEEPTSTMTAAGYLVRFVPTENDGAYNIQFGTGNWLTDPVNDAQSSKFTTSDDKYDAGEFNLYYIDTENAPGVVGFNVYDMKWRIDNNVAADAGINTGNTVVTWDSGKHETAINPETGMIVSNSIWSIVEVVWGEIDPYDAVKTELEDVYNEYQEYLDQMPVGNEPGQYDAEAVAAFVAAMAAAESIDDPDNTHEYTVEELRKMIDDIKSTYEAALASQVKYTFASGYYFIRNGFMENGESKWYETVTVVNEANEEEEITIPAFKYMSATLSGTTIMGTWGNMDMEDVTTTAPALWKITAEEGGVYDIVNLLTGGRFNKIETSKNVTLDPESENRMAIDYAGNTDDVIYVDIRVSTQAPNDYFYLHTGGHGGGSGKSGNLVGWSSGKTDTGYGATEWTLIPVDEDIALKIIEDFAPYQNHDKLVEDYKLMISDAKAKIEIAKDIVVNLDNENPLITTVEQLSSPYTEASEGSIDALIDGNASTFWHSAWSDGSVAGGTHYLQVEMPDMAVTNAAFTYTRRAVDNDHLTEVGVFGTNDAEAEKDACEELGVVSLPFDNNSETLTSGVFPTKGFKYLRFYGNTMYPNTRGYFHMAEFQLYPAEVIQSETCQYNVMGDIVKNLEGVIEKQKDVEMANLTNEEYNEMKTAYEAFIAKFVDPSELRQTIENISKDTGIIVIGTNPGFWPEGSSAQALANTIDVAKAYDAAGDYAPTLSEKFIEVLKTLSDDIYANANKIQTNKWYKIRFAPESMFDEYEWDKVAGEHQYNEAAQTETSPELFGKYITAATLSEEEVTYTDNNDGIEKKLIHYEVEPADASDLSLGSRLYLMDDAANTNKDMALFRFVAVGDSAYLLQNKATGLFIKAAGTSGAVSLSVHPSLFDVRAIGYGLNVMAARSITGTKQSYLHAQVAQNVLVTWDVDYPGSRSGFLIEEAGDIAADFDGTEFNLSVLPGSLNTFCYPMELSVKAGEKATMWSVESVADNTVTLTKITTSAIGGRPFILIQDEAFDPEAPADETVMVVMRHTNAVTATEPQTSKLLKGTFAALKVGAGVLEAKGNGLAVTRGRDYEIAANKAYIQGEEAYDREATFAIAKSDAADAIETIVTNATRPGAVYTMDGRMVSRRANINQLPKGIYIINGIRVVIK